MAKSTNVDMIQIAQIREIFTLFDKDSDGNVAIADLGTIVCGLKMNPTQAELREMEKDVDPNESGEFDQMNLISLIARAKPQHETIEEMTEAIKVLVGAVEDKDKVKINVDTIRYYMLNIGEKMDEHELELILADCADIIHDDFMIIDDFANYLISR